MSEKMVLVYSEGDIELGKGNGIEQLKEVFKEYKSLKGDPFSEVYKGKKVTQTLKVVSDSFYAFMLNVIRADEGIMGVIKRKLVEEKCEIIFFDNVEFVDIVLKYDESLKNNQEEYVRGLNALTEEREYIKKSFSHKS